MSTKKTECGQVWVKRDEVLAENMPSYFERRIMAYGEDMMCVENTFKTGEIAPEHKHPHVQITYIISGAFRFTIGDETVLLMPGDSAYMASDVVHSAVCEEGGVLLDFFAPMRPDFV